MPIYAGKSNPARAGAPGEPLGNSGALRTGNDKGLGKIQPPRGRFAELLQRPNKSIVESGIPNPKLQSFDDRLWDLELGAWGFSKLCL
jgi:hypothetical protein